MKKNPTMDKLRWLKELKQKEQLQMLVDTPKVNQLRQMDLVLVD